MIISIVATFIPLNTPILVIDLILLVSYLYLQAAIIKDYYWVALLDFLFIRAYLEQESPF